MWSPVNLSFRVISFIPPRALVLLFFLNYPLMYVLLQITEKRLNDKVLLILKLFQKRSLTFISFKMT